MGAILAAEDSAAFSIGSLVAALVGGLGVALLTFPLNIMKTKAEVAKLRAETKALEAQLEDRVQDQLKQISERIPNVVEEVIYDSTRSPQSIGHDFKGLGRQGMDQGGRCSPYRPRGGGGAEL